GHARAQLAKAGCDAARDARDRGHARAGRAAGTARPCLSHSRRRAVLRGDDVPAIWSALALLAVEDASRPGATGRHTTGRFAQTVAARLRALAPCRRRADVAERIRPLATRLAPRMFGDVAAPSGPAARRARRRRRPHLSAPRIRDRAVRGRDRTSVRALLGPCRGDEARRRE